MTQQIASSQSAWPAFPVSEWLILSREAQCGERCRRNLSPIQD